jgi:hypothetical protein
LWCAQGGKPYDVPLDPTTQGSGGGDSILGGSPRDLKVQHKSLTDLNELWWNL